MRFIVNPVSRVSPRRCIFLFIVSRDSPRFCSLIEACLVRVSRRKVRWRETLLRSEELGMAKNFQFFL